MIMTKDELMLILHRIVEIADVDYIQVNPPNEIAITNAIRCVLALDVPFEVFGEANGGIELIVSQNGEDLTIDCWNSGHITILGSHTNEPRNTYSVLCTPGENSKTQFAQIVDEFHKRTKPQRKESNES